MNGLAACGGCGQYLQATEHTCPFCGTEIGPSASGASRIPTAISMALGLALTGCSGMAQALYGIVPSDQIDTAHETGGVDQDSDGYYAESSGGEDCNDEDAAVHPTATETTGDGVDSNCDGEDDT